MSDRRTKTNRRARATRRTDVNKAALKLIEDLRMQARTRRSANAVMRVEPTMLEKFLEWQAADLIEELLKNATDEKTKD